ncbi:importin alpha [Anaeramoeba flamelloides]|uniref:Importin alpha n=1 Tax=Anaeramoeba flamelloides TaxID=1746091 RepID=A0ABQ8Z4B2_9EUKA|nr:importin alpha [Anaeramoeba flamelloides]
MKNRFERRKKLYKKTSEKSQILEKRNVTLKQIRKSKKDRNLLKRRIEMISESNKGEEYLTVPPDMIAKDLASDNIDLIKKALRHMKFTISQNPESFYDFQKFDIIKTLLILIDSEDLEVKLEIALILLHVSSGTYKLKQTILDFGSHLVSFLNSKDSKLQEISLIIVANLSGECLNFRNQLVENGILEILIALLEPNISFDLCCSSAFAISNLLKGEDPPLSQIVELNIFDKLDIFFQIEKESEIHYHALWILSYLTSVDEYFKVIIDSNLMDKILLFFKSTLIDLRIPAIRIIANFLYSSDTKYYDYIINENLERTLFIFTGIIDVLNAKEDKLIKEICWLCSAIFNSHEEQILEIIELFEKKCQTNILEQLSKIIINAHYDLKREAAIALMNAWEWDSVFIHFISCYQNLKNFLLGFFSLLNSSDPDIAHMIMDFIELLLNCFPKLAVLVENCDGISMLEKLRNHPNKSLFQRADDIIDEFFGENYDPEFGDEEY